MWFLWLQDALTLQRVCLEKKTELCADEEYIDVPDVRSQVQELLMNLFISTFSHTVSYPLWPV